MFNVSDTAKGVVGRMTVYCAIDNDKYERIRYIADTLAELGKILNANPYSLASYKSRGQEWFGMKIIMVEIDD
jgi:hypothetical protein